MVVKTSVAVPALLSAVLIGCSAIPPTPEGQSIELVGRCAMYRGELGSPCAMQNQLLRFRAYQQTVPAFAEHLFRRCQHVGVFAAIATQTTSIETTNLCVVCMRVSPERAMLALPTTPLAHQITEWRR